MEQEILLSVPVCIDERRIGGRLPVLERRAKTADLGERELNARALLPLARLVSFAEQVEIEEGREPPLVQLLEREGGASLPGQRRESRQPEVSKDQRTLVGRTAAEADSSFHHPELLFDLDPGGLRRDGLGQR